MIFSLLVIIFIGLIAYWHFLQGFFSSAISAVLAIIAALIAVGYHEELAGMMAGKMDAQISAISLVLLFALSYLIMRILFDMAIPGNVRFPVLLDKIGGPVMGIIAGIFATGVLVIAAQTLPFGPSIAGYARYPVAFDKKLIIRMQGKYGDVDAMYDEIDHEKFTRNESADSSGLWVGVDDMLLGLVKKVSAPDGSLSAGRSFEEVHPDYLQELFGQRVGLQNGSRRTASAGKTNVQSVHLVPALQQIDQERFNLSGSAVGIRKDAPPPQPQRVPAEGNVLIVVRTKLSRDDADEKTNMVALSPANVRLVAKSTEFTTPRFTNYFPIGTLEKGRVLYMNVADDYIFVPGDKAVDLVFEVDEAGFFLPQRTSDKNEQRKIAPGAFLEVKRQGRVLLAGMAVQNGIQEGKDVEVVRKEGGATPNYQPPANQPGGGGNTGTPTPANAPTLTVDTNPIIGPQLFTEINVGSAGENEKSGLITGGEFSLQAKKISKLNLAPTQTIALMSRGPNPINEFAVPQGSVMIQILAKPAQNHPKWAWSNALGDFRVVDSAGKRHVPYGALAKVTNNSTQQMLAAIYDMNNPQGSLAGSEEFTPTDVTLLYLIPSGTELKSLDFKEETMRPLTLTVQ